MTVRRTHSDYVKLMLAKRIRPLGVYETQKSRIDHKCLECKYIWNTLTNNALRHGCPKCAAVSRWNKRGRKRLDDWRAEIPLPTVTLLKLDLNKSAFITARCDICENVWKTYAQNLVKGHGCASCAITNRVDPKQKTTEQFVSELLKVNPNIEVHSEYVNAFAHVTVQHSCGVTWLATPANLLKGRGCPACKNKMKFAASVNGYVRGYEPQALDWILARKLAKPEDIVFDTKDPRMPVVSYTFSGKHRRYLPDFFIPKTNRIVEVKSVGTLGLKLNAAFYKARSGSLFAMTKAKAKACLDQGYKFTLLVMNEDGSRISLPVDWFNMTLKQLRQQMEF